MPFQVRSTFVGDYKLGDNINHNLDTLDLLYRHYTAANEQDKKLLRKPITITLVSIIEAVLFDLHKRIRLFTYEGVQNVAFEVSQYVRGKQLDELEKLIVSAKKHDLFDMADTKFYDRMEDLRKLRNRIHIQNRKNEFELDEWQAFSQERMVLAERVLEKTLRVMLSKFDRGPQYGYVRDFSLPWNAHFSNVR